MQIDKTGFNACQFDANRLSKQWNIYYAAINEADWNKYGGRSGVCGRCLKVRGVKGETTKGHKIKDVIVKVVDLCPEWACPKKEGHNIDFSTTALEDITGYHWDKKLIDWEFAPCDEDKGKNDKWSTKGNKNKKKKTKKDKTKKKDKTRKKDKTKKKDKKGKKSGKNDKKNKPKGKGKGN